MLSRLCCALVVGCAAGVPVRGAAAEKQPTPAEAQFFEKQVRPLLAAHCYKCHGAARQRGDLRLDSRKAMLEGGESGPAVVSGKPAESRLVDAINYRNLKMPPDRRLSSKDVATLTRWVQMGAPWPGDTAVARPPHRTGFTVTDADRKFWSFHPVLRPSVPKPAGILPGSAIDAFVLQKLQARGLTLSPSASKRELIRRATFDLIGLPPSPEEVDAFLADRRPDAYERLVERLLASPHYGERWGRHWLDVVRFAQTNGYERDDEKPHAWRYRDYVIRAFNEDVPYDRFIREQLAGDELDAVTDDALTATAFYRLGVWDDEPDDRRQAEFDELDDMLSVTGSTFLGLTLGCARCHDHKFDPLGQEDYYSTLAFLRNVQPYAKPDKNPERTIFVRLKSGALTLAIRERDGPPLPTHILSRGSAAAPGKRVEAHFPRVLCPSDDLAVPRLPTVGGKVRARRSLAEWIASKDNPLTARVLVNRLWQHHFGRGLVATPNDFGHTGVAPTHPKLLDWLAAELVEGGWRLKRLHRQIMLSQTYRQSSRRRDERAAAIDPGNALLGRQNLRRLEAEAIRDTVLAVSGRLNRTMGGRGVFPTLPPEVLATQSRPGLGWDKSSAAEQARRGVYIFVKRTLGVPLLETFDFASPDTTTAARATTTIAPQALILLNSAFMEEQSLALAQRLVQEDGARPAANVERLFRLAFGRGPTSREKGIALAYLARDRKTARPGEDAFRHALARLCKVVLNLNELVYVD